MKTCKKESNKDKPSEEPKMPKKFKIRLQITQQTKK